MAPFRAKKYKYLCDFLINTQNPFYEHMEWHTPVRMYDEGVIDVQLLGRKLVLLSALVLDVVTKAAGEPDLGGVVNIASNLEMFILTLQISFF